MKVLMLSGGLDSTILFYDLLFHEERFQCAFIDYGQKNAVAEQKVAEELCRKSNIVLTSYFIPTLFQGVNSTLLRGVSGQHTTKSDEIPNRNATLACIVAAQCTKPTEILFAAHKTGSGYADARTPFYSRLSKLLSWSTNGKVTASAPFIRMTKKQIIKYAYRTLALTKEEINQSISCYEGNNCGKCPACKERKRALEDSPYEI